jgi:hypothetical protein
MQLTIEAPEDVAAAAAAAEEDEDDSWRWQAIFVRALLPSHGIIQGHKVRKQLPRVQMSLMVVSHPRHAEAITWCGLGSISSMDSLRSMSPKMTARALGLVSLR